MNTDHSWLREQLGAFLDGELSPEDRATVERHLPTCETCRSQIGAWTELEAWLASASEDRDETDGQSIVTALANAESELSLSGLERFFLANRYLTPVLGAAAVLVTLLAIWLMESRPRVSRPSSDLELLSSWEALQIPSIVESSDALEAASLIVEELDR